MDATRLRKTFKYLSDNEDSDDSHDEMDEEEQEQLITALRAKEASENKQYALVFSLLPLTVTAPFIYYLIVGSRLRSMPLLCLLSITSLLSSAYTMRFIPIYPASSPARAQLTTPALFVDSDSPVQTLLPWLNLVIALLLLLTSWAVKGRASAPEALWLFLTLPAIMMGVITVARKSMADVQEGIGALEGKKYDYKGA